MKTLLGIVLCETNEIGVLSNVLLVQKEKKKFIGKEENKKGAEARHYIEK